SISTRKPFLYTWHMGITRNAYQRLLSPHLFKPHRNVSTILHAYAARIMRMVHPSLVYAQSNLVIEMANLLKRAFPNEVGNRLLFEDDVPVTHEGDRVIVKDLRGAIIFDGMETEYEWDRYDPGDCAHVKFAA